MSMSLTVNVPVSVCPIVKVSASLFENQSVLGCKGQSTFFVR